MYQTQILLEVSGGASPVMSLRRARRDPLRDGRPRQRSTSRGGSSTSRRPTASTCARPRRCSCSPARSQTLRCSRSAARPAGSTWPDSHARQFRRALRATRGARSMRRSAGATGPRYFQLLVDKRIGSRSSRSSSGTSRARRPRPTAISTRKRSSCSPARAACGPRTARRGFRPGDVIFLPRKQLHSLEATSADGIDVVGVICPGDNPSITYYD